MLDYDRAVLYREPAGELVDTVASDVACAGVQAGDPLLGLLLALGSPARTPAPNRAPSLVKAAGVVRAALAIELTLVATQRALRAVERPRVRDQLTGREDGELAHADVHLRPYRGAGRAAGRHARPRSTASRTSVRPHG